MKNSPIQDRKESSGIVVWKLLSSVARGMTLTQACNALDLSLSAASKLLSRYEAGLDFPLFEPGGGPKRLSAEALQLMPEVLKFTESYDELMSHVRRIRLTGHEKTTRLSVATGSLNTRKIAALRHYESRPGAPHIEVEVDLEEDSLLEGRSDAVVVSHPVSDPKLTVFPVGVCANLPLASPAYLARHGTPHSPEELAGHTLILTNRASASPTDTLYKNGDVFRFYEGRSSDPQTTIPEVKVISAAYYPSLLLAEQGNGIALDIALGFAKERLERGQLVAVLDGWHRKPWRKFLVVRTTDLNDPRFKHFVEWYCRTEPKASCEDWTYWYRYFAISTACVPEHAAENLKLIG